MRGLKLFGIILNGAKTFFEFLEPELGGRGKDVFRPAKKSARHTDTHTRPNLTDIH